MDPTCPFGKRWMVATLLAATVVLSVAAGPAMASSQMSFLAGPDSGQPMDASPATSSTNEEWIVEDANIESDEVTQGENVSVNITFNAVAGDNTTHEIVVDALPFSNETVTSKNVSLGSSEEKTVTFELSTENLPPGEYEVWVGGGPFQAEPAAEFTVVPEGETINYQVDFIVGNEMNQLEAGGPFYSDQGRLIRFLHGSTDDPVTRGGAAGANALADEHADCIDSRYISVDPETNTATISFTVEDGCEVRVSLASYVKPGPGFDREYNQRQFDQVSETLGPGTHTLVVQLPTEEQYVEPSANP